MMADQDKCELRAKQSIINDLRLQVMDLQNNQQHLYAELFCLDQMSVWQFFLRKLRPRKVSYDFEKMG